MKHLGKLLTLSGLIAVLGCDVTPPLDDVAVTLSNGQTVAFTLPEWEKGYQKETLKGDPSAARLSERTDRKAYTLTTPLLDAKSGLELTVFTYQHATDSGNYARAVYTLKNTSATPIALDRIRLIDETMPVAPEVVGNTDGAVLLLKGDEAKPHLWYAIEHPMTRYEVTPEAAGSSRTVAKKTDYTIADLTNAGNRRGTFEVPVKVTDVPMTMTITYQNGNLRTALYGVEAIDPATGNVLDADTPCIKL